MLKGSAVTLGATALAAACQELETLGHEQILTAARDALARARQELAQLSTALEPYVSRMPAPTD